MIKRLNIHGVYNGAVLLLLVDMGVRLPPFLDAFVGSHEFTVGWRPNSPGILSCFSSMPFEHYQNFVNPEMTEQEFLEVFT